MKKKFLHSDSSYLNTSTNSIQNLSVSLNDDISCLELIVLQTRRSSLSKLVYSSCKLIIVVSKSCPRSFENGSKCYLFCTSFRLPRAIFSFNVCVCLFAVVVLSMWYMQKNSNISNKLLI